MFSQTQNNLVFLLFENFLKLREKNKAKFTFSTEKVTVHWEWDETVIFSAALTFYWQITAPGIAFVLHLSAGFLS